MMSVVGVVGCFYSLYGDQQELHVLTHSCPTRRSADRWETDPDGRVTWVSSGAPLPARESLGRLRWEIAGVDPASDPLWRAHLDGLLGGRAFRNFRYEIGRAHV